MNNKIKINIEPPTSIYSTYQRLTYTIWNALAEFLDNSTASYYSKMYELKKINNYNLSIEIIYYKGTKKEDSFLKIIDNAYGMELEDFKRAILLNKPPDVKTGRNEFGMGLKTAACWFGKIWKLTSTQLGSQNEYSATMNVEELEQTNEKELEISSNKVNIEKHGTILTIKKLNRFIQTQRQRETLIEQLSSMYRKDINNEKIEIRYIELDNSDDRDIYKDFNNNKYANMYEVPPLKFTGPKVYSESLENGNSVQYYKQFDDYVEYEEKKYYINGFIAIRERASRSSAGFTLIRRGRVIIGGNEANYRPKEIFTDSGSFIYQRLFGEINMDNWPVTQAKNGFDWDNGLEDAFINKMKIISAEYRIKANEIRKNIKINPKEISNLKVSENNNEIKNMYLNKKTNIEDDFLVNMVEITKNKTEEDNLASKIEIFTKNNDKIELSFESNVDKNPNNWIDIKKKSNNSNEFKFRIIMYLDHSFFKPYTGNNDFLLIMRKFIIAFASSIIELRYVQLRKQIDPITLVSFINSYLLEIKE